MPSPRDADTRTGAIELFLFVTLIRGQRRAADFITAIVTVWNSVAFVRFVDALFPVAAFELLTRTRDGRTAFFVFVVETVIVTVANPRLRNTMAGARASELEVGASSFSAKI